jgi:fructokinase
VLLAEQYAAAAATVVFEPSTPANAALIQRAMDAASIVKGSHEHGPGLVESHRDGRSGQVRVITDGIRGARVRVGSGTWRRAGVFPVEAVDAAGAGDWTTAGMLHTIIGRGEAALDDVARGISYGHALAALNCALPGARGLAEHRDLATIEQLAVEVQSGASVEIHNEPQPTQRVPSGVCSWCLLDTDRVADATTPSARATVASH